MHFCVFSLDFVVYLLILMVLSVMFGCTFVPFGMIFRNFISLSFWFTGFKVNASASAIARLCGRFLERISIGFGKIVVILTKIVPKNKMIFREMM